MLTEKDKQEISKIIKQELWDFFEKFYRWQGFYESLLDESLLDADVVLNDRQRHTLQIIYDHTPKNGALQAKEICALLEKRYDEQVGEDVLMNHVMPVLKRNFKVKHQPSVGYYIAK